MSPGRVELHSIQSQLKGKFAVTDIAIVRGADKAFIKFTPMGVDIGVPPTLRADPLESTDMFVPVFMELAVE